MVKLSFSFQRADGLLPYRVMNGPVTIGKYLGRGSRYQRPRPTYRFRGFGSEIFDGSILTLLWLSKLGVSGWDEASTYLSRAKRSIEFLYGREREGLLWDGLMAEWNDTAYKFGNLLYSNLLYWKMLDEISSWFFFIDDHDVQTISERRDLVRQKLNERLWSGEYFADWCDFRRQDYFYSFGNLLAVVWGLVDRADSLKILSLARRDVVGFTLETNSPKYPWWRISPFNHLIGLGDYQNHGILWWQPGVVFVLALLATGQRSETLDFFKRLAKQAIKHKGFWECYERDGRPVERMFYRAEFPFAWGAGMFLWAAGELDLL